MSLLPNLRRLALVLALLPQLLMLGAGPAVVVCVAPGGHMQVEAAASACCRGPASAGDGDLSTSQGGPDCGACSDIAIALDPRVFLAAGPGGLDLPSDTATALPVMLTAVPITAEFCYSPGRSARRGHLPPHLVHLRSVLLRC